MADQQEFVGFGPAAEYLGIKRNTLTSYCSGRRRSDGSYRPPIGPEIRERRIVKGWALPVFDRFELDRWRASRLGRGARTDLAQRPAPG